MRGIWLLCARNNDRCFVGVSRTLEGGVGFGEATMGYVARVVRVRGPWKTVRWDASAF